MGGAEASGVDGKGNTGGLGGAANGCPGGGERVGAGGVELECEGLIRRGRGGLQTRASGGGGEGAAGAFRWVVGSESEGIALADVEGLAVVCYEVGGKPGDVVRFGEDAAEEGGVDGGGCAFAERDVCVEAVVDGCGEFDRLRGGGEACGREVCGDAFDGKGRGEACFGNAGEGVGGGFLFLDPVGDAVGVEVDAAEAFEGKGVDAEAEEGGEVVVMDGDGMVAYAEPWCDGAEGFSGFLLGGHGALGDGCSVDGKLHGKGGGQPCGG